MNQFGKRLGALETRSTPEALGSAGAPALNSTSTPAPEMQNGSGSTPTHSRMTPWADRSLTEVPNYEETIVWPDEEDGVEEALQSFSPYQQVRTCSSRNPS